MLRVRVTGEVNLVAIEVNALWLLVQRASDTAPDALMSVSWYFSGDRYCIAGGKELGVSARHDLYSHAASVRSRLVSTEEHTGERDHIIPGVLYLF